MEIEFGYYPLPLSLSVNDVEIRTLPGLDESTALVCTKGVEGDWIYAPPRKVNHIYFGTNEREIRVKPYVARVFDMPKTHVLHCANAKSSDYLTFLLWALSFFKGMRLTAAKAGFVDATPIAPSMLVDFAISDTCLAKGMSLADVFWHFNCANPMRAKRFAAAVHGLFLGQNPRLLQFESFMFLYAALDACFALASSLYPSPKRPTHANRIAWLCDLFSMTAPAWATKGPNGKAEIGALRNDTIHEALFMGEPLGFALHGIGTNRNLTLEMEALVCRFLVALLGASSCDYIRTPITTRQRHLLIL